MNMQQSNKIVRSICLFRKELQGDEVDYLAERAEKLTNADYTVQTKRICHPGEFKSMQQFAEQGMLTSVGTVPFAEARENLPAFYNSSDSFNVELSQEKIDETHAELLFEIIKNTPEKTFNFTYVFNNSLSSPFMPSASYEKDGFAVGFQFTDLAEDQESLSGWLEQIKLAMTEVQQMFASDPDYLGIDSSIAPLFSGKSSLVEFINRITAAGFSNSVTTDIYTQMSKFIKENNPKQVGLSGLMFPCLEDFALATEYEQGNFTIERNIFLSLHSGLGIDTYPIGVDENPARVVEIIKLAQALSNKYNKPLSVRFVSDGKAKIGEQTDFQNQYLKDVKIRKL